MDRRLHKFSFLSSSLFHCAQSSIVDLSSFQYFLSAKLSPWESLLSIYPGRWESKPEVFQAASLCMPSNTLILLSLDSLTLLCPLQLPSLDLVMFGGLRRKETRLLHSLLLQEAVRAVQQRDSGSQSLLSACCSSRIICWAQTRVKHNWNLSCTLPWKPFPWQLLI